jgi:transcriptional regulator with XRE-family HTH domain
MPQTLSGQVAATIRAEMARHKCRQQTIADALGLSVASVSRRLSGEQPFELDELATVAELFGLTVSDLIESDAA